MSKTQKTLRNNPDSFERGPETWSPLSDEEIDSIDSATQPKNVTVLNTIIPRLWIPAPLSEMILALEVIEGPYRGVIFSFISFKVHPLKLEGGWQPAKFEVKIWKSPKGFEQDEAFDNYASDILLAWLSFMTTHQNEMAVVKDVPPVKGIH